MQKIVNFNVTNTENISGETIRGILLNFRALQADGETVCDINDLNLVQLTLTLKRRGRQDLVLFNGDLDDYLVAMYSQTPRYQMNKTKRNDGYKVFLDFHPGAISINRTDRLEVRLFAKNTAFTSLNQNNSTISIESVPAASASRAIQRIVSIPVGKDKVDFDDVLENDVFKVVAATDYTTPYESSTKAQVDRMNLTSDSLNKDVSADLIELENIHFLHMNPETDVEHCVLHWGESLKNPRLKVDFSKAADIYTKILTVGWVAL